MQIPLEQKIFGSSEYFKIGLSNFIIFDLYNLILSEFFISSKLL